MVSTKFKGVVFDLDGVITDTAKVHALAWESMFNEFLKNYSDRENRPYMPFDRKDDYQNYVDGKPRYQGVKSFLSSRGIQLPFGSEDDPPDAETVCGLGNKKNVDFQEILRREGPSVYGSTVQFIQDLKELGVKVGVASSSRNCRLILEQAKLTDLFETRVDGEVSAQMNLQGKPEPDIFIVAAENLGLLPDETVVVEDAISGVQAGRAGNFGMVIGVARSVEGGMLTRFGADIVVRDLSEVSLEDIEDWFTVGIYEDGWSLAYDGLDPGDEKLRETLTTVGNGYMGVRGCFVGESASFFYYPGTYIAGIYNSVPSQVEGREIWNNDFVNCPNWLLIELRIGAGDFISPLAMELLSYKERLHMRQGTLQRTIVCKDQLGRITRIDSRRIVSMADPHMGAVSYEITPCNYTAPVTIRSSIDGNVTNQGVPRYRQLTSQHLELQDSGHTDSEIHLLVRTTHSDYKIAMRARNRVLADGKEKSVHREYSQKGAKISEELTLRVTENIPLTLEKLVCVYTSLDAGVSDPVRSARDTLSGYKTFASLYTQHAKAWDRLWNRADIDIDGDRFVQRTLRLHIYHLLVTASPHNVHIDAGMPARGLHGEAYRGHIFWDELYILPFFDLHFPDIAKALLMYRYRRLDAARDYARENGYQGAMYPWQTCDTGGEETQEVHYNPESKSWGPDLSRRQRHVSIAVFYNIWQYVDLTGDKRFLHEYGAEVMFEIARFWSSIAEFDEGDQRYHIRGVMGPDEFHEKLPDTDEPGLTDNAYTNIMVVWLLERALDILDDLPAKVRRELEALGITAEERDRWADITRKMHVIITEDGIISQFEGYMDLDELDWDDYRQRYYSIHRMDRILKAEGDSPDHYKVAKQADTLMTYYVLPPDEVGRILRQLGHEVDDDIELLKRNYDYYEKRTSHGSTLSMIVHAVISTYFHAEELAWNWFLQAMRSDVFDTQGGTTTEGIHSGVMAGTVDAVRRYFAGIDISHEVPEIAPHLPAHWRNLRLKFQHRRIWYELDITPERVRIGAQSRSDRKIPVKVMGRDLILEPGRDKEVPMS
jgi:beta-phosphoglucomutase family hydrolase